MRSTLLAPATAALVLALCFAPAVPFAGTRAAGPAGGRLAPVEATATATLTGKVVLHGDPAPYLAKKTRELRERMEKTSDGPKCLAGTPEETTEQSWRVGANKQVGNVFVWLQPPAGFYFPVARELADRAKASPVVIDQPCCAFLPHCSVLFPEYHASGGGELTPTGQTLTAKNSATFPHNIKWSAGNFLLPPGGRREIELKPGRLPEQIQCSIHPWMEAWVLVCQHPYAALSRSDTAAPPLRVKADDSSFGTYAMADAPAGVRVRLFAWHEGVGWLHKGGSKGEEVELKPGKNVRDFVVELPNE
jgi:hypothetical protein